MGVSVCMCDEKKQWNLSDKENGQPNVLKTITNEKFYFEEDVKEFIKRLKEVKIAFCSDKYFEEEFELIINKLAGEKLIN
jgi:hypothetical protein